MTNPYYNHGSYPAPNSAGASASMRSELDAITAGFNKLPGTLTANGVIFVNASGTALEARSGIDGVVIGGTTPAAGTFTTLTLTSGFVLPLGAVGTPSLSFTGDSNNGWWSPGADVQAWSIAGAEAMRLNSTGLGLGGSPSVKRLTLGNSAGATEQIRFRNTTADMDVGMTATGMEFSTANNVPFIWTNNAAARMTLDASGRLGIGTTGPLMPLQLNIYGGLDGNGNQLILRNNSYFSGVEKYIANGFAMNIEMNNVDGSMIFKSAASGLAGAALTMVERMRLDANGNLGIGRAPTQAPFDAYRASGGNALLNVESNVASGVAVGVRAGNNTRKWQFGVGPGLGNDSFSVYDETAAAARLVITSAGNVAIGGAVSITGLQLGDGSQTGERYIRNFTTTNDLYLGQSSSTIFGFATGTIGGVWQNSTAVLGLGTLTNVPMIFGVNNVERARIDTSGRLGIAMTPITKKLETAVVADGDGFGLYYQTAPTGLIGQNVDFYNWNNSAQNINVARIRVVCDGGAVGSESGYLGLWTKPTSGAIAERIRISQTGLVDVLAGSGSLRIGSGITRFESAEQSVPTTTFASNAVSHGGPRVPDVSRLVLRCKTAELGYSVGDEVDVTLHNHTMSDRAFNVWHSATQTGYVWITGLNVAPSISHKTTGTMTTVTAANWRVVVYNHWL